MTVDLEGDGDQELDAVLRAAVQEQRAVEAIEALADEREAGESTARR